MSVDPKLIDYLAEFSTPERFNTFREVLKNRTRHITVLLEDIYQSQNASAVLRTCDCFGIQDVHIVENNYTYDVNPDVALGADKWLSMTKYNALKNNTEKAIYRLRKKGYKIIATTPHSNEITLDELDVNYKTALIFGTELHGISDAAKENADAFLKIPMYGFTESFNISVSVAICLHHLTMKIRSSDASWMLTENEKNEILLDWLMKSIKSSKQIVEHFLSK